MDADLSTGFAKCLAALDDMNATLDATIEDVRDMNTTLVRINADLSALPRHFAEAFALSLLAGVCVLAAVSLLA